jgi:hypothetical protein
MSVARSRCWRGLVEWWRPSQRSKSRGDATAGGDGAGGGGKNSAEGSSEVVHWLKSFESGCSGPVSEAFLLDPRMYSWVNECESTEAELAEFLACDQESTEADPRFREELREQLWSLVEEGELLRRRDH